MQLVDGTPVFAATDLVGFLACEHLTTLDRALLHGMVLEPGRDDPELEVLRRRGHEHEDRYLADLIAAGLRVADGRHPRTDTPADSYATRLRAQFLPAVDALWTRTLRQRWQTLDTADRHVGA
jgi:hypothetical protein